MRDWVSQKHAVEFNVIFLQFECCGVNGTDNWNIWMQACYLFVFHNKQNMNNFCNIFNLSLNGTCITKVGRTVSAQKFQSHGKLSMLIRFNYCVFSCHPGHETECQNPWISPSNSTGIIFKDTCHDLLRNKLLSSVYVAAWLSIVECISLVSPFSLIYKNLRA